MIKLSKQIKKRNINVSKEGQALLFVLPALIIYGIFVFYPILKVFILSFYDWDGIALGKNFIGLKNYSELFLQDKIFRLALINTLKWVIITLSIPMVLGLILASVLAGKVRGRMTLVGIFFLPFTIAPIAAGIIWAVTIYHPSVGILNHLLRNIGMEQYAIGWLGNPDWALYALVQIGNWTYLGFCLLIFFDAMQSLDPQLYEAATIDGANKIQLFWHLTIPLLRNSITFVIIYSLIRALRAFAIVFVLTGGGPYDRTQLIATYLYRVMFTEQRVSYGASIAVILLFLSFSSTLIIFSIREKK